MKRLINPTTNAPGLTAVGFLLYTIIKGILNVRGHHAAVDLPVILSSVATVLATLSRFVTTPPTDARNGAGEPMMTSAQWAEKSFNATIARNHPPLEVSGQVPMQPVYPAESTTP